MTTSTSKSPYLTAKDLLDTNSARSANLQEPPPPQPTSSKPLPAKLDTPNWSGMTCDFYHWLSSILNRFSLTRVYNTVKVVLTLQAILLVKQGPFNNISDWQWRTRGALPSLCVPP